MVAHSEKRWGRDPLEQTRLDVHVGLKNILKLNLQLKSGHSEKGIKFEKNLALLRMSKDSCS